jgi:hypothetical protein
LAAAGVLLRRRQRPLLEEHERLFGPADRGPRVLLAGEKRQVGVEVCLDVGVALDLLQHGEVRSALIASRLDHPADCAGPHVVAENDAQLERVAVD